MGYLTFFGCLFICFGPAIATFIFVLSKSPQLVIISIGSSFFWLLSLLLAAIWWYIIPLRNAFIWVIPWTIFFQEGARMLFFKLYIKGEKGLVTTAKTSQLTSHPDQLKVALAFGLGSGVTHALITYVSLLWDALGPGTAFCPSCPSVSLFLLSAIYSLFFILFHMCWSVVSFDAFRKRNWKIVGGVAGSHLVASLLTMLNLPGGSCFAALFLLFALLVGTCFWTFRTLLHHANAVGREPVTDH